MRTVTKTLALLLMSVALFGCAEDTPTTTPDPDPDPDPDPMPPVAIFSASAVDSEGDTVRVTNTSTGADSYRWVLEPTGETSFTAEPSFVLRDAGSYTLTLTATNADGDSTVSTSFEVAADTTWRMFGHGTKTWYLHRLSVGGVEEADKPCYGDNTLLLDLNDSTYSYEENDDVCSPPGFIFVQSGTFVYTPFSKITLRAKKPFASNQAYNIDELSRTRLSMSYTLSSQEKVEVTFGDRRREE